MDREQFLKNKIKSLKSDNNFNNYQANIIAQTMYAQQGTVKKNLTDLEAKQANNITGINFNREGIDQLFMTEAESEKERQAKFFAQKNLETQRRNKITDITAETQSPFANRRIWHDQKPEYYTSKGEVTEGNQYTTIPYSKWEDYKKTPQYLNYKNPNNQTIAYNQQAFGTFNPQMFQYPNIQSQMMSPKQDFSFQNQNYQRNIHTPAQQPQTKNDFIWGDNNGDGITDEKDSKDKFGNSLKVKTDQEIEDEEQEYNTRYNIMNPYGGMDLESSLAYTGQQFSKGNTGMGIAGAGLSLLKGARNFMGGYASGKESNRVKNEYLDKRFNQNPNFARAQQGGEQEKDQMQQIFEMIAQMLQQQIPLQEIAQQLVEMGVPQEQVEQLIQQVVEQLSQEQPMEQEEQMAQQDGKIKNSEMLTGEFIAEEGQGNTNLEDEEFVKRAETGDVKKVVGEPHLKNGKIAEGVNANLEEGDKVLSNYTKIPAKTVKELKERYSLSLKKDATFADAQKAFDKKLGVTKATEDLAQSIEKMGKNEQVKDETTKRLNELTIADEIAKNKEKLEMLKDPQSAIFEQLFAVQETIPKLGNGNSLFDKNGKEVTEKHSSVAQQGGYKQKTNIAPPKGNLSQEEIEYLAHKWRGTYSANNLPSGGLYGISDINKSEEMQELSDTQLKQVSKYMNETGVLTDIYQGLPNAFSEHRGDKNRLLQQGGIMDIATKYGISEERAKELVGMQQGGMIKRADGSYSKRGLWDNIRKNRGSGRKPTKQMLEQERKINKNRQEGGEENSSIEGLLYTLKNGAPPEQVLEYMVKEGMDREEAIQLIEYTLSQPQKIVDQQGGEQEMPMQQGGIPESYRNKGFTKVGVKRESNRPGKKWMVLAKKGDDYKIVHGGASGMKDYSQHGSEDRKKRFWDRMGGRNSAKANDPFSPLFWHKKFGKWQQGGEYQDVNETSDMIEEALNEGATLRGVYEELVNKGLSEEMASDLLSEYDEQDEEQEMAQQGMFYAQEATKGKKQIEDYLSQWMDKPTYKYGDTKATAERFKPFFDKYGIKYTDADLTSNDKLDALAGQLQTKLIETNPELAEDYGERIEPTRKGLQWLVDNKAIKPLDYGLKLINSKVAIGSYGNLSDVQQKKLQIDVQALEGEKKKEFSKTNYNDNQAFFRTLDAKDIEFTDKAEYDQYVKDNEKNKVGKFFRTDKIGAYINPIFKEGVKSTEKAVDNIDYSALQKTQNTPIERTENVMPWLPQALRLAPSALDPIAKSQIALERQESLKMSPESMLAEQARQREVDMERFQNSGLTSQQQQAMMASGLASSQMASNDAINKVESYNAQNQFATDQFNIGQGTKEDITNEQFRQDYQNKVMQSMANQERDWKNYYTQNNLDNANNFKYIEEMNWLNAKNDQFQNVPGQGITYLGNKGVTQDNTAINKLIDGMTPKERFEYTKEVNNGVDKWKAFKTAKEKALS